MGNGQSTAFIGTSGYHYDHWREVFYPEGWPKKSWFEYYAKHFSSVEINNTFYHLPSADTLRQWHERTPPNFCYSLKFSRYGSHIKRLKDPENTVENFVKVAQYLGEFMGPILVQLPPKWKPAPERLDTFLETAPAQYRWCIEVRDERWLCDDVYAILQKHNSALCIHDLIDDHPHILSADWTYLRYHGRKYGGDYPDDVLRENAALIEQWLQHGMDVYAYFNNDAEGYAVRNAQDLKHYIQQASTTSS